MADRRKFLRSIVGAACAIPVAAIAAVTTERAREFTVSEETSRALLRMQEEVDKTVELSRQLSAGAMSSMRTTFEYRINDPAK